MLLFGRSAGRPLGARFICLLLFSFGVFGRHVRGVRCLSLVCFVRVVQCVLFLCCWIYVFCCFVVGCPVCLCVCVGLCFASFCFFVCFGGAHLSVGPFVRRSICWLNVFVVRARGCICVCMFVCMFV